MQVGQYAQWTANDEQGKFNYVGQISKITDTQLSMAVPSVGNITVALSDGSFKVVNKPNNFDKAIQHKIVREQPRETVAQTSNGRGDTKQQVIALYNTMKVGNTHPRRGDVIKAFVDKLNLGTNTASTYQHNCKTKWCIG